MVTANQGINPQLAEQLPSKQEKIINLSNQHIHETKPIHWALQHSCISKSRTEFLATSLHDATSEVHDALHDKLPRRLLFPSHPSRQTPCPSRQNHSDLTNRCCFIF
jgi:hypothetical protein